jgi:hypothetical protein
VSIKGSPISRSGAIACLPSSSLPITAAAIARNLLPRIGSGTSGNGGRFIIRSMLVASSGALAFQSRYARSPSRVSSAGNRIDPA